jgi:hypothetical protein
MRLTSSTVSLQVEHPAVKISIFFRCGMVHPPPSKGKSDPWRPASAR